MAVTLDTGLKATLVGDVSIAALISTRCYPMQLPQEPTLPSLTYRRISAPNGREFGDRAFTQARYQITAWDDTYLSAETLGDLVISLLDDYSGTMNGLHVSATVLNDIPLYDEESGRHAYVVDVELWH